MPDLGFTGCTYLPAPTPVCSPVTRLKNPLTVHVGLAGSMASKGTRLSFALFHSSGSTKMLLFAARCKSARCSGFDGSSFVPLRSLKLLKIAARSSAAARGQELDLFQVERRKSLPQPRLFEGP